MSNMLPPVQWRLRHMMAECNIRSGSELQRRLNALGIDISTAQVLRLVAETPKRLSLEVFGGLLEIFNCEASDLIQRARSAEDQQPAAPVPRASQPVSKKPRQTRAPKREPASDTRASDVDESIIGPKVTPLPVGPRRSKD